MARRLFRGRAFSENGWPYVDQGSCTWIRVPGAEHVSLQIQNGAPLQILRAFAADYHAYVEPLRDPDSACWTADNSVASSNHPGGTSMDLNWQGPGGKAFRLGISKERAFPGAMSRELDVLYDFYEDIMFCGGEWSIQDWMHHQLRAGTYDQKNDRPTARVTDFIARKIRPDGFSTYRRGNTSTPPAPPTLSRADKYALAVMNEGRRRGISARGIQIAFSVVYVESNWKMYANSKVPESLRLPHDAVGSDHDSVGLFQQRCPMWGPAHILMDPAKSAGLFYDRLVKMDYNNPQRLPGDFAADVQRPAKQYRGRYQERMGDAIALYNRITALTEPTAPADPFEELLMAEPVESWSIYATPGEPKISPVDLLRAIDAKIHRDLTEDDARAGDPEAIRRVARTAAGMGKVKTPGAVARATRVLNEIHATNPQHILAALGKA